MKIKRFLRVLSGGIMAISTVGTGVVSIGGCHQGNDGKGSKSHAEQLGSILEKNNKSVLLWDFLSADELANFNPSDQSTTKDKVRLVYSIEHTMCGEDTQPTIEDLVRGWAGSGKHLSDVIHFTQKPNWEFGAQLIKFAIKFQKTDRYDASTFDGDFILQLASSSKDSPPWKVASALKISPEKGVAVINPLLVSDPTMFLTQWTNFSSGFDGRDILSQIDVRLGGDGRLNKVKKVIAGVLKEKVQDVDLSYLLFISPGGRGYHEYNHNKSAGIPVIETKTIIMKIQVDIGQHLTAIVVPIRAGLVKPEVVFWGNEQKNVD